MTGKPGKCTVRGKVRWYTDHPDALTGKRKRTFFDTQNEAKEHQGEVNRQPKATPRVQVLLDPDVALAPFAAEWLVGRIETGTWKRPGTIEAYRGQIHLRICGHDLGGGKRLGDVPVRDLHSGHAEALVQGMRREGFAPRTTAQAYQLFSALLHRAVRRGLLPRHPIDRDFFKDEIRPHLITPKEDTVKAFEEGEAQRFLAVTRKHSRLHALYAAGFLTGCRLGELLALHVDAVQTNLVSTTRVRQLLVAKTLTRGSTTTPVEGPTKTGATRWVDVGMDLGTLLERIKADRPVLALKHAWRPVPPWVFISRTGRPLDQAGVRRDFDHMLSLAGLAEKDFTPHSMRHSFASWHIVRGCNSKWLQQQLGHAKIGITLDLYANWFKLSDAQAADTLGTALLGNAVGNSAGV